ncbi:uncharacterized protein qrfp [Brachyistius frenatus]|uniref:uncharacterized protein qrfp n=1 Tax=Brachyistius frenatus TaxID=100188 RepID=UPI0037E80EF0
MRLSFHLGASQLALLFLPLLLPVTSHPCPLGALPPTADGPKLESVLLDLRAALEDPGDVRPEAGVGWPRDRQSAPPEPEEEEDEEEEEDRSWEEEQLPRAQRGDPMTRPLSPFLGGHSPESVHYPEGVEGEDGWKRNEALTSIAGGLQAVSREKGGFGFRFGRKRWTDGRGGDGEGAPRRRRRRRRRNGGSDDE